MSTEGVRGWGEEKKNRNKLRWRSERGKWKDTETKGKVRIREAAKKKGRIIKGFSLKTKLGVWTVGVKDTAETVSDSDSERSVRPDPIAAVCVSWKNPQYRDYWLQSWTFCRLWEILRRMYQKKKKKSQKTDAWAWVTLPVWGKFWLSACWVRFRVKVAHSFLWLHIFHWYSLYYYYYCYLYELFINTSCMSFPETTL